MSNCGKEILGEMIRFINDGKSAETMNITMLEEEWQAVADALEKQIPKKPKKYKANWLGDDKYTAYDCPRCKKCFTMKGFFDGRNAFCDICGQAIDWSEVEYGK